MNAMLDFIWVGFVELWRDEGDEMCLKALKNAVI